MFQVAFRPNPTCISNGAFLGVLKFMLKKAEVSDQCNIIEILKLLKVPITTFQVIRASATYVFIYSISETFSEPCQISKMEHLAKIVNSFHPLTISAKSSILDLQGFK